MIRLPFTRTWWRRPSPSARPQNVVCVAVGVVRPDMFGMKAFFPTLDRRGRPRASLSSRHHHA